MNSWTVPNDFNADNPTFNRMVVGSAPTRPTNQAVELLRNSRRDVGLRRQASQADIYQMIAYGQLYRCDRLMLLYPHHSETGEGPGVLARHLMTGTSSVLETASLDIVGEVPGQLGALDQVGV